MDFNAAMREKTYALGREIKSAVFNQQWYALPDLKNQIFAMADAATDFLADKPPTDFSPRELTTISAVLSVGVRSALGDKKPNINNLRRAERYSTTGLEFSRGRDMEKQFKE